MIAAAVVAAAVVVAAAAMVVVEAHTYTYTHNGGRWEILQKARQSGPFRRAAAAAAAGVGERSGG